MNTPIRTKDITLTDAIRSHIDTAKAQFMKYSLDITTMNVSISKEKQGVCVEFDIHISHQSPVVISQTDQKLDAAIDIAIERTNKALRRLHDKVKSHRGRGLKNIELAEEA